MLCTISRPPNDDFTYSMFEDWLSTMTHDYAAYYLWSCPPDVMKKFLNYTNFGVHKNVIIGIKDLLDMWIPYNYWHDTAQVGTQLIKETASKYPDTNFIICTSLENLHHEDIQSPNIQILPWGGDLVNQPALYKTIVPVLDKNFESTKSFICLNRNYRDHRIVVLCYLYGSGLDQYGKLSCLGLSTVDYSGEPDNFLDRIFWEFDEERHDHIREIIINGYPRMYKDQSLIIDDYKIYKTRPNDNYSNFNNQLRSRYEHSFVEIVTETTFASPGFLITEKTLNSVYGCNFPIILSGNGAVSHLRELGFDMFDDVIDHSYDSIVDPFDRIVTAIETNRRLLIDVEFAKQCWKDCKSRFSNNIEVAKNIDTWYRKRGTELFKNLKWK